MRALGHQFTKALGHLLSSCLGWLVLAPFLYGVYWIADKLCDYVGVNKRVHSSGWEGFPTTVLTVLLLLLIELVVAMVLEVRQTAVKRRHSAGIHDPNDETVSNGAEPGDQAASSSHADLS
jgi:hypothetical protein